MEEHEGYLYLEDAEPDKKGVRGWKQHWFVLDEGYLRYFHKEGDLEPLAAVPCRGFVAKSVGKARVGKHAFRLDTTKQEDGRYKYVLAGDDEDDSLTWLEFLREHGASVNISKIRVRARAAHLFFWHPLPLLMHLSSLVRPQLTARPEGEKDDLTVGVFSS